MRTLAALLLCWLLSAPPAPAQVGAQRSDYWPEVEKVDAALRKGRWKPARRQAAALAEEVLKDAWYGTDLKEVLVELAFYQAAALANLERRREAVWYWHVAQNLDFRVVRRDLAPYGEAGKLLREFPLRKYGEVPAGFQVPSIAFYTRRSRPPAVPDMPISTVLTNTGAVIERPKNLQVELVIDEEGVPWQPVVTTSHLHPIAIYAMLEKILGWPPFEPAVYENEPTDALFLLTVRFKVERW